MLPDPSEWTAEAFSLFRQEGLPPEEWPQYRNCYIVQQTQLLADERSKAMKLKLEWNRLYGSIVTL